VYFNQIGILVLDNASERSSREQEPVVRLRRNPWTLETIMAHRPALFDGIGVTRGDNDLPETRVTPNVIAFLLKVYLRAWSCLTEPVGDVENFQVRGRGVALLHEKGAGFESLRMPNWSDSHNAAKRSNGVTAMA